MPDILWPTSLQSLVNADTFSEKFANTLIRSDVEQGPPKVRRRFTKGIRQVTVSICIDADQYEDLEDFYDTETAGGSLQFLFNHPITGVPTYFRFVDPPDIKPLNGSGIKFTASMNWEILP